MTPRHYDVTRRHDQTIQLTPGYYRVTFLFTVSKTVRSSPFMICRLSTVLILGESFEAVSLTEEKSQT